MLSVGVSEKNIRQKLRFCMLLVPSRQQWTTKQGTVLPLVDFSSAFDTINHNILIRRLRLRCGFVGKALDLVISYLEERTQRIVIGDQSSSTTTLTTGVPQGSVLGPLLFSSNLSVTSYYPMDYSSINMPMIYRYILILT